MISEDDVCSFELANKLKDLGVKQESQKYFCRRCKDLFKVMCSRDHLISAFTRAELRKLILNEVKYFTTDDKEDITSIDVDIYYKNGEREVFTYFYTNKTNAMVLILMHVLNRKTARIVAKVCIDEIKESIEPEVCSFELAKKLKELGITQQYAKRFYTNEGVLLENAGWSWLMAASHYAAFTKEEIFAIINDKDEIEYVNITSLVSGRHMLKLKNGHEQYIWLFGGKEVDNAARFLIYILEKINETDKEDDKPEVIDVVLAKQLRDLGVKQVADYYWNRDKLVPRKSLEQYIASTNLYPYDNYAAFDAEELEDIIDSIPEVLSYFRICDDRWVIKFHPNCSGELGIITQSENYLESLAEVLIELLKYLRYQPTYKVNGMKPFNISRALAGDPVVTRDGRKVLELHFFSKMIPLTDGYPVGALIDGEMRVLAFSIEGRFDNRQQSKFDLFMA